MDYFNEFEFNTPKQHRAIKTINDIIQSLETLSQDSDIQDISTRQLSKHSGYAVGTIFHHFKKLDDIFVYAFLIRQKRIMSKATLIITNHPTDHDLCTLICNLLKSTMNELSKPRRQTLIFLMNQFNRRTKYPQLCNLEADILIPIWKIASQQDKTHTIFNFSENELRLKIRALQAIIRSPFFEDSPMAGTAEHKSLALNNIMRLFAAPA